MESSSPHPPPNPATPKAAHRIAAAAQDRPKGNPGSRGEARPWYVSSFGDEYLKLYAKRDDRAARHEVDFACKALSIDRRSSVLDLCCGAGRHLEPLVDRGIEVVGLDRSRELLQAARRRLGSRVPIVAGDMRRIPFSCAFRVVLSFFTSFGYFDDEQNARTVGEIARVLVDGGALLMDLMDRDYVVARLVAASERRVDDVVVEERRWYDGHTKRIEKESWVHEAEREPRRYFESVRVYTIHEIRALLEVHGLEITDVYSGFERRIYARGAAERMVVCARKGRR